MRQAGPATGIHVLTTAEDDATATALCVRHGFRLTGEVNGLMADGERRELVMTTPLSSPG